MKSSRWKTAAATGLMAVVLATPIGCAKRRNKIAQEGGIFGPMNGDYIILNYSGTEIMDCWKLRDVYVQSEENSDGWLFRDEKNNVINISGSQKVMRVNDRNVWDKYHEFHKEFEGKSYTELYGKK